MSSPFVRAALGGVALASVLTGCSSNDTSADATVTVTSSDDACDISTTEAGAGSLAFEVTNSGSQETEFYLYGDDGVSIIGEVEDIGPGLTRTMVVEAEPGSYVTACKPGMVGDGIRGGFTVTG